MSSFSPFGATLWYATGASAPVTEPLSGLIQADICIVGACYIGLTSALELAREGVDVILLERQEIGFGGSGRRPIWQDDIENGTLVAVWKTEPATYNYLGRELEETFVVVEGETIYSQAARAPRVIPQSPTEGLNGRGKKHFSRLPHASKKARRDEHDALAVDDPIRPRRRTD